MATRIHVAAVRNVPVSELQEELKDLGEFEFNQANGWVWFMARVWFVSGQALLDKLEKLPRTTFLATTEDGCRWYLHIRGPGKEPYDLCHEFAYLGNGADHSALEDSDDEDEDEDELPGGVQMVEFTLPTAEPGKDTEDEAFFNEDDSPEAEEVESPFDPIEEIISDKRNLFGCPLPRGVEDHLRSLPHEEAMHWLFAWESAGLIGALKRFGVPHSADEVASIILGESVTEGELENDLGNLPRLLVALGLGEYWEQAVEQIAATRDEDSDDEEEPLESDAIDDVLRVASDIETAPIDNGPVDVPIAKAAAIALVAKFCDTHANAVFHLTAEGERPAMRTAYWLDVRDDDNNGVYAAPVHPGLLDNREIRKIGKRLAEQPDGVTLEVLTGSEEMRSGRHKYVGPIENGYWRIERAAPCHDGDVLREAIALVLNVYERAELRARDQAEADAVLEAARQSVDFEDIPLHCDRLVFQPRRSQRHDVGRLLFRQRFRNHFDVEEGERADAEEYAEWQATQQEINASLGIPKTGKTILEGRASRYNEVDLAGLETKLRNDIEKADTDFAALGFEPLGTLVPQAIPTAIMRAYAKPDSPIYAVFYPQNHTDHPLFDYYTAFDRGASLTTSTVQGQFSYESQGIYHRTAKSNDPAKALEEHNKGLAILQKKGLTPTQAQPTIQAFAQALDDYLQRRLPE